MAGTHDTSNNGTSTPSGGVARSGLQGLRHAQVGLGARGLRRDLRNEWELHTMILPGVILLLLFHYKPIYGILIAFNNYRITDASLINPPWTLRHFRAFLSDPRFWNAFRNTMGINILGLIIGFPIPVIFALMLNEVRSSLFRRFTQTVSYLPHFISWVVFGGIIMKLLSPSGGGLVNDVLLRLGAVERPIFFMGEPRYFWLVAVLSRSAKEFGWSAILYLSAMAAIDPDLYEAATIDGAGRFRRMWHVTLPGILGTMVILLILTVSNILNWGFEQIWMLQNALNLDRSDTLETFVYRIGIRESMRFSYAAAVGLTKSVVAVVLLVISNSLSKRVSGKGIY